MPNGSGLIPGVRHFASRKSLPGASSRVWGEQPFAPYTAADVGGMFLGSITLMIYGLAPL